MPQNYGFRNKTRKQNKAKDTTEVDEQNEVMKAFRAYAKELDSKHDRHERIVKLSRDITIESKRIIFLLHTIDERKGNKDKVLEEAEGRLNKVIEVNFKELAKELEGQSSYQFRWAYSPGLQEFIEAWSFMEYFKSTIDANNVTLSDWNALQKKMECMKIESVKKDSESEEKELEPKEVNTTENLSKELEKDAFGFFVYPTEYILGLSDVTGELMRRCITSLGSGDTDNCMETCKVLQQFYAGYISLNVQRCRELSRKIYTMRQSVLKAENVCYNVKVRGTEAAKWGISDNKLGDDVDEGFY